MKTSSIEVVDGYELIRKQNDEARREIVVLSKKNRVPCKVLFSARLKRLGREQMMLIRQVVASQNIIQNQFDFHSEHDFGLVKYEMDQLIWKIDYVSKKTGFSAEDPADLEDTVRLLSIMYDYEY